MSDKIVPNAGNASGGRCSDIYANEMELSLKTLKRFREAWLRSSSGWNTDVFQYADPDFYFFRFAIDRQEKNKEQLLTRIILGVLKRYDIPFETPEDSFPFVICSENKRIGFRFKDFYPDEDINDIIQHASLDQAFILRTWKPGRSDDWIERENRQYAADGLLLKSLSIKDFFTQYFSAEEYTAFLDFVDQYLKSARETTGYKSIKFYSAMNLAAQRAVEEKFLLDWQYKNYTFQIIDPKNPKTQKYQHIASPNLFSMHDHNEMEKNYLSGGLFRSIIGSQEYAESFLTSEWLFYSLEELNNFDYTAVICGYLKSVEQLLQKIVMINVDNSCRITMNGAENVGAEAYRNRVKAYIRDNRTGVYSQIPANTKNTRKYIDLVSGQEKYIDPTMGTFEYFLRNNPNIFIEPSNSKNIADLVCCFREESRNIYLHTHNLHDWPIVKKIRSNAIFLYYVLLGGSIIPAAKTNMLGILAGDSFDELCKRIREFHHFSGEFIFEYADGKKLNLIYDFMNNTMEFSEGIEHYQSLTFYEVEDFSLEAYEKLDEGIREEQIVYLKRDNLPKRILGLHRDGRTEEIQI